NRSRRIGVVARRIASSLSPRPSGSYRNFLVRRLSEYAMPDVIIHREGVAGRITLNRPAALHALNEEMCLTMDAALKAWADDDEVELVVVDHADGTRGFCAGGDIRMLAESGAADGSAAQAFFRAEYRLNTRIKNYPKPYVAFIDGVTM